MENRTVIQEKIKEARVLLSDSLLLLIEENANGKQFDYVNSPRLSDNFDALNKTVERMGSIIYQTK